MNFQFVITDVMFAGYLPDKLLHSIRSTNCSGGETQISLTYIQIHNYPNTNFFRKLNKLTFHKKADIVFFHPLLPLISVVTMKQNQPASTSRYEVNRMLNCYIPTVKLAMMKHSAFTLPRWL